MSLKSVNHYLDPPSECNILFLGLTGAGKSTTINALANYVKFPSFEEALSPTSKIAQLIPTKFHLPDPESEEPFLVQCGHDENEDEGDGKSCTQSPIAHEFVNGNRKMRIIDTPGIGDTRGVDVDQENFEKIMAHLRQIKSKQLHGICILMKATENRFTSFFRYCITELLVHLHKNACKNIVFCFTYSRLALYRPGDAYVALKKFLAAELKDFELKPAVNCFFIDNEGYRYIVAKRAGYKISDEELAIYKESWVKSSEQSNKMLERILKFSPHSLDFTTRLYSARKLILKMAEPMVRLEANINKNVEKINEKKEWLKNSNEEIITKANNLQLEIEKIVLKELKHPVTVCTNTKCIEVIDVGIEKAIKYKVCHSRCYLEDIKRNSIGNPKLKYCWAMTDKHRRRTDYCAQNCGCIWQKHMHIYFEYKVSKKDAGLSMNMPIVNARQAVISIQNAIQIAETLSKEYKAEYDKIMDTTVKFGYILSNQSTKAYNNHIGPYIDLLLDEEKKFLDSDPTYSNGKYKSLIKMKENYNKSLKYFEQVNANPKLAKISIDKVEDFCKELFQLKHYGVLFKQIMNAGDCKKEYDYREQVYSFK